MVADPTSHKRSQQAMGLSRSSCAAALEPLTDAKTSPRQILLLGLGASGKTTLLYKMHLGEVTAVIPTIGFMVESVECKALTIVSWDIDSRTWFLPLWRNYFKRACGMIFVVDSADHTTMDDARDWLARIVSDEQLGKLPVLILANKKDLPAAQSETAVATALALDQLDLVDVQVQRCCATTMEGVVDGLTWLATTMAKLPARIVAT